MIRLSLDTNILVYGIVADDPLKVRLATSLVDRLVSADSILLQQVYGELLNVIRKRRDGPTASWREGAEQLTSLFAIVPTPVSLLLPAFDRALRYKLQFWDALILTVCLANGVTHLLSEDLQDGQNFDGLVVLNPFNDDNRSQIDRLLDGGR